MSLFEDMILNEARAIHPQPMVKDKDDATPSVTTANGNQSVNQPEQDSNSQPPDLNSQPSGGGGGEAPAGPPPSDNVGGAEEAPQGPPPQENDMGQEPGGEEEAPPEEDQEGEAPPEEGEEGEGGEEGYEDYEDGEYGEEGEEESLDSYEKDVFRDLSPEQMIIKNKELKAQFKSLNNIIFDSLEKLNNISHTSYDNTILDFVVRKLVELKDISRDYTVDAFNTKSYIENQIQLQKMVATFNRIVNLLSNVRDNRQREFEKELEQNKKYSFGKGRANDYPYIFSKDIDYE
jgi:hypothetical protein